jgi:hypothetical protein
MHAARADTALRRRPSTSSSIAAAPSNSATSLRTGGVHAWWMVHRTCPRGSTTGPRRPLADPSMTWSDLPLPHATRDASRTAWNQVVTKPLISKRSLVDGRRTGAMVAATLSPAAKAQSMAPDVHITQWFTVALQRRRARATSCQSTARRSATRACLQEPNHIVLQPKDTGGANRLGPTRFWTALPMP